MKKLQKFGIGLCIGVLNIFLGTGGGVLAVTALKRQGMSQKDAQANAIAIIFPISLISLIIYVKYNYVNLFDAFFMFVPIVLGAAAGTFLYQKVSNSIMKGIFCAFMIWSGVRLLLK